MSQIPSRKLKQNYKLYPTGRAVVVKESRTNTISTSVDTTQALGTQKSDATSRMSLRINPTKTKLGEEYSQSLHTKRTHTEMETSDLSFQSTISDDRNSLAGSEIINSVQSREQQDEKFILGLCEIFRIAIPNTDDKSEPEIKEVYKKVILKAIDKRTQQLEIERQQDVDTLRNVLNTLNKTEKQHTTEDSHKATALNLRSNPIKSEKGKEYEEVSSRKKIKTEQTKVEEEYEKFISGLCEIFKIDIPTTIDKSESEIKTLYEAVLSQAIEKRTTEDISKHSDLVLLREAHTNLSENNPYEFNPHLFSPEPHSSSAATVISPDTQFNSLIDTWFNEHSTPH